MKGPWETNPEQFWEDYERDELNSPGDDPLIDFGAMNKHYPLSFVTDMIRRSKDRKLAAARADALGLKYDPKVLL